MSLEQHTRPDLGLRPPAQRSFKAQADAAQLFLSRNAQLLSSIGGLVAFVWVAATYTARKEVHKINAEHVSAEAKIRDETAKAIAVSGLLRIENEAKTRDKAAKAIAVSELLRIENEAKSRDETAKAIAVNGLLRIENEAKTRNEAAKTRDEAAKAVSASELRRIELTVAHIKELADLTLESSVRRSALGVYETLLMGNQLQTAASIAAAASSASVGKKEDGALL